MKKIFFLMIFSFSSLFSQILEVKNIKEITTYLNKYELLLFDLDNTIMEPIQELGSDQWFFHQMKKYENSGLDKNQALEKTLIDWHEIQAITKVKLVEKDIKNILENLQMKNTLVMGLTTRDSDFSLAAIKQLDSLKIDFSKTAPKKETFYFENGVLYKKGILFAKGIEKGRVLDQFLKKINFKPKSVVFIDDKLNHLDDVEKFCKKSKIKFLGLRYGHLDEKVKNFQGFICDLQHKNLKNILSDEEAKKLIVK
ncbi:MAG: hypothetical protein KR126chlam5_01107 [Candidatus Anoxychlamydiales bacterium]|nr:hypothetical protein [Candidatus Anoxychlamydiales bacterium]